MRGCFTLIGYFIIIVIIIGACSAIFGDDETKTKDKETKTEAAAKNVFSYNEDKAQANENGDFSLVINVENGYKATLKSEEATLEKSEKGKYQLSGNIQKDKETKSYKLVFTKDDKSETATIKVSNKKAYTLYKEEQTKTEAVNNEKELSYGMLNKSQDGYEGKSYHISSGHVMQAMEDDGQTLLLVEITNKGYGFYDDIIAVRYDSKTDAVEDDLVEVYGTLTEKLNYDTQIGGSNSVPAMDATSINVVGKVN